MYIGSHNFSPSAWGSDAFVANYELGVVLFAVPSHLQRIAPMFDRDHPDEAGRLPYPMGIREAPHAPCIPMPLDSLPIPFDIVSPMLGTIDGMDPPGTHALQFGPQDDACTPDLANHLLDDDDDDEMSMDDGAARQVQASRMMQQADSGLVDPDPVCDAMDGANRVASVHVPESPDRPSNPTRSFPSCPLSPEPIDRAAAGPMDIVLASPDRTPSLPFPCVDS
jgi:hypothetical protein